MLSLASKNPIIILVTTLFPIPKKVTSGLLILTIITQNMQKSLLVIMLNQMKVTFLWVAIIRKIILHKLMKLHLN